MLKITSHNVNETENCGKAFAKILNAGDFVALYGDLGAGKTAFIRGLGKGIGFGGEVTSPTFALIHEYVGEKTIIHFDMYRINDIDSLYSIGFYDFLDGNNIIATEWSENIPFALPKSYYKVTLQYGENEEERMIAIDLIEEREI